MVMLSYLVPEMQVGVYLNIIAMYNKVRSQKHGICKYRVFLLSSEHLLHGGTNHRVLAKKGLLPSHF